MVTNLCLNMRAGSMFAEVMRTTCLISFAIILSFSKFTRPSTLESLPEGTGSHARTQDKHKKDPVSFQPNEYKYLLSSFFRSTFGYLFIFSVGITKSLLTLNRVSKSIFKLEVSKERSVCFDLILCHILEQETFSRSKFSG